MGFHTIMKYTHAHYHVVLTGFRGVQHSGMLLGDSFGNADNH